MKDNLRKNYFWFVKALETYGLGLYFIVVHSSGNFTPPGNVLEYLDDPPFVFLLAVVGTVAMVYSLWNVEQLFYKPLMTGSLTFAWLIMFGGFVTRDIMLGTLSIQTMYAFFVVFSIIGQLVIKRG
ncbi:hypothetical protein AXJ17_gp21 [Lactobacillus phage LfeSau]|uniref:hypothetical protein n=1 Tax=Lactobacillus phage LfeSau TaxID=1567453 RepID=UPI0005412480|nr:hypothetical protein AXJ17_gp21 [Lactobacillus phage LfeSau]AIY32270.1 hypothetical protein LfeSau_21 [Lactobacillus phage LfeSau]